MSVNILRKFLSLCCLFWTSVTFAQGTPPPTSAQDALRPFLLGGIQTHEKDHQRWAAALHRSGMNAVQVTVYAHQGAWNTAKLWYAEDEPAVLNEIRVARQNGLQVVLVLRIALDHNEPANRFLWHGLIYPQSDEATREWFRIYTDFVIKWAHIAEREGVDVLGVGSEMNSLAATLPVESIPHLPAYYLDDDSQDRLRDLVVRSEDLFSEDVRVSMGAGDFTSLDTFLRRRNAAERTWATAYTFADTADDEAARVAAMNRRRKLLDQQWRNLVQHVRRAYSGRLTLAANFDNYHEVSFWDVLDLMGINAYFPLRDGLETPLSKDGLADDWRRVFDSIDAFKQAQDLDQGVLFTELGYTRRRGVTVAPWSSKGFIPLWDPDGKVENDRAFFWAEQPIEPAERALALEALHHVWSQGDADLDGLLYWKLSSLIDLHRYEPFMLYLGTRGGDPSFPALTRFADGIRPFAPRRVDDSPRDPALDAILQDDVQALRRLPPEALVSTEANATPLLHTAIRLGRHDAAHYLLAQGAALDRRDAGGRLAIHWACYQDDPSWVPRLRPPAGTSWRDHQRETPLMLCARLDNTPVARQLLHHGDAVGNRNELGQSALHMAADQASVAMVELLVGADGDVAVHDEVGMTPLHWAARRGEPEIMKALAKDSKGSANAEGNRPVAEAAIYGRRAVFQLLFEPTTAKEINGYGQSLLHLAAHGGDLEILETLLPYFSDVDPQDDDGWTPLAFATRNARTAAVALLVSRGADIEHRNKEGVTPLQLAASSHEPALLQHFVQQDIDLDLADADGNTALHHSAGWGHVENIRILLAAGADFSRRNGEGDTPLDVAERFDKGRAVQLLRQASAAP